MKTSKPKKVKKLNIEKIINEHHKEIIEDFNTCPNCGESLTFKYIKYEKEKLIEENSLCEICKMKFEPIVFDLN